MLSRNLGQIMTSPDGDYIVGAENARGHLVACQYEHVRPGRYRVDFRLAVNNSLSEASLAADEVVANLDVSAAAGAAILAQREVTRQDLVAEPRVISLDLTLREFRSLEYRVFATGRSTLTAWKPTLVKLGDEVEPWPLTDPNQHTTDPVELGRQARAVLRLLEPRSAVGCRKIRLGNVGDGGYVSLDYFREGDIAFSLGINDDITWDKDAADRGLLIQQFDHTVEDPAPSDPRMVFYKKKVSRVTNADEQGLPDLVSQWDNGETRPNLVLKMDIEGSEWEVWDNTPKEILSRFSQILCEVHWLDKLSDTEHRQTIYRCFRKLHEHYAVIHVHGNSCAGWANVGNVMFPNVLEISFANRACFEFTSTEELFPGPLDCSCDAYKPDLYLGSFKF